MKLTGGKYLPLLVFMTILFGLSFIATKYALQGLGIFQVIFARFFLALIVLTFILWRDRSKFNIARGDRKHFLLLTMVEPVGYFVFETYGIRYASPSSVSIIIATIPIFSLLFALWILKEKTTRIAILGIIISLVGVYFIVSTQGVSVLAPHPVLGIALTLGAAMSAGLYNVLSRRLTQTYSPWTVTYYQSIVASIVFLPLAVGEGFLLPHIYIDEKIVLSILYLAFGSSVIAYFLLNFSLSRLPTYKVAVFANFVPVVTITASWLVYGEILSAVQFTGAMLVIVGIYLTYYRYKKTLS